MAKYFIRPTQDLTINHELTPVSSTFAYILIAEEEPDDSSTYISHEFAANDRSTWECLSSFVFSCNDQIPKEKIKSAKIYIRENNGALGANLINYRTIATIGTKDQYIATPIIDGGGLAWGYSTKSADVTNFFKQINNINSFNVSLTMLCDSVTTSSSGNGKTYETRTTYISTAWIEIKTYENIGVYEKNNGNYRAAINAYKKVNGTWAGITENECKEILKNNTIRRG